MKNFFPLFRGQEILLGVMCCVLLANLATKTEIETREFVLLLDVRDKFCINKTVRRIFSGFIRLRFLAIFVGFVEIIIVPRVVVGDRFLDLF